MQFKCTYFIRTNNAVTQKPTVAYELKRKPFHFCSNNKRKENHINVLQLNACAQSADFLSMATYCRVCTSCPTWE